MNKHRAFRIKESNHFSGKLHKGCTMVARNSTIPTKYQTIVTNNADKKGFGMMSKRFVTDAFFVNDNPGPGSYIDQSDLIFKSPSFSSKGTAFMASKNKQSEKQNSTCSQGPAFYSLPSLMNTRNDFCRLQASSSFAKKIAKDVDKKKFFTPAPNQYNVLSHKKSKQGAEACFKSNTKRDIFNSHINADNPSPWQYDVRNDILNNSSNMAGSSFKSSVIRNSIPVSAENPGPGAYCPYEPAEMIRKHGFPRKHYLCLSAPAIPPPDGPPVPGPGSYEVVNYNGPEIQHMSSACFLSETSRWLGNSLKENQQPGPGYYNPITPNKQSFHFNHGGWI